MMAAVRTHRAMGDRSGFREELLTEAGSGATHGARNGKSSQGAKVCHGIVFCAGAFTFRFFHWQLSLGISWFCVGLNEVHQLLTFEKARPHVVTPATFKPTRTSGSGRSLASAILPLSWTLEAGAAGLSAEGGAACKTDKATAQHTIRQ